MYGSKLLTAAVDNNNNKVQQSFGRPWMWGGNHVTQSQALRPQ